MADDGDRKEELGGTGDVAPSQARAGRGGEVGDAVEQLDAAGLVEVGGTPRTT